MLVLIYDSQIAGVTEHPENQPFGFSVAEAPDLPLERLYWDGQSVEVKPEQPSPAHFWDILTQSWVSPNAPPLPLTLERAIAQAQSACLDYWNALISNLTLGYPPQEVSSWTELKAQAEHFLAHQDFDAAATLYQEIMLRQFGAEATAEFREQFRADSAESAIALTSAFAQLILQNGARLVSALAQYKGLRGYHWDRIASLEAIDAAVQYDFTL